MKNRVIRFSALMLTVLMFATMISCNKKNYEDMDESEIAKLSFKAASGYDYLKELDGKVVTISGYMATSSPVDGSFMFLVNLPYQSCPFCVPNTSQLSNTMEVYPKKGEKFEFTAQAVKITGILEVADNVNEPFTDKYGYEFNYKIVDAEYRIIKSEEMSEDMAIWQQIASTDVVNDIYKMYDYLNFTCAWNTYYVNTHQNEKGETITGYFLYAEDAQYYIKTEGAQWNYGYKDEFYEGIIAKIKGVDPVKFADLIANIEKARALGNKAVKELDEGHYTKEYKYVEKFGKNDYVYTIDKAEELKKEFEEIYIEFSNWLGSWEM